MTPLPDRLLPTLRALLNGCSQIFLQQHALCGALILVAIAVENLALLPGALLGALSGLLVAWRLGYGASDRDAGLYGYNATLVGLLFASQFLWSLPMAVLLCAAAALATALLHALLRRGRLRGGLPVYTLPFVLFGWLSLASAELFGLESRSAAAQVLQGDALGLGAALLRSIGQVIFLGSPLAGACVLLALLFAGWRCAAWALGAAAASLLMALSLDGTSTSALFGLAGYNAVLVAIALSHRRIWAPLLGILLSWLLQPCFGVLGLPPLTAPFILACWLVLAAGRSRWLAPADATLRS
ncbi:urea transporter [Pseudomonas sp. UL073]|uniref:Urea transporter n=1 Tax=Zestomonas insulae TaxID=2809017 RepID=A0ABS2ICA0_9GAMM|nr:urea transporter [Pseudomonas insulae]MBM7060739.1 urea transporter [Pseudomonas insulae]